MDTEEVENRKVLQEKHALLEKLKQEVPNEFLGVWKFLFLQVSELKRGGNLSASSLDTGSTGTGSIRNNSPPDKPMKKRIGHLFGGTRTWLFLTIGVKQEQQG